jgi:hydrogenase maturation factor
MKERESELTGNWIFTHVGVDIIPLNETETTVDWQEIEFLHT